jgi:Mg/Co/Ni transporter MgtE
MNQQLVQKSTDKIFASKNTDELIDVMKEQAETAEREKILNAMTPECRKKLEYIDTWLRNEVSHTLYSGPHCLDQKVAFLSYTFGGVLTPR